MWPPFWLGFYHRFAPHQFHSHAPAPLARALIPTLLTAHLRFFMAHPTGIIPGVGDAADAILGYVLVIRKARRAEYVSASSLSVCPHHRPLTLRSPVLSLSPLPFPLLLQDTRVAHAAHAPQPRHRDLSRACPYRRRRDTRRLPCEFAQRHAPRGVPPPSYGRCHADWRRIQCAGRKGNQPPR